MSLDHTRALLRRRWPIALHENSGKLDRRGVSFGLRLARMGPRALQKSIPLVDRSRSHPIGAPHPAAIFSIPTLQSHSIPVGSLEIPYQGNIFRHNIGWENLSEVLTKAGYNPATDNLISDKYQTVSVLSFYGPQQHRAYFFNLMGIRRNQFSYWPGIDPAKRKEKLLRRRGKLTTSRKRRPCRGVPRQLQPFFGSVKYLGMYPLFSAYGTTGKGALIFECLDFTGAYPEESQIF